MVLKLCKKLIVACFDFFNGQACFDFPAVLCIFNTTYPLGHSESLPAGLDGLQSMLLKDTVEGLLWFKFWTFRGGDSSGL